MHFLFALLMAQSLFSEMQWRHVGPFRGGRTKAATGVAGKPGVFYIGPVNGGVFRTDDYGRTWTPLFDDQPTGSVGALAVAGDTIYVGSGEGLQRPDLSVGDGIYKSVDAGKTWRHLGLRDGQQIPQIALDPRDSQRLFVAVLGHPYGPNEERGVFRSTDGGEHFEKVLYVDADTGAADVVIDPADPRIVYATLWAARQGPWENGEFEGATSGFYKSTDDGTTWRKLGKGLPESVQRIGLGIAPSRTSRLYATVVARKDGGLYRSDDAGESWTLATSDDAIWGRGDDFAEVKVDPVNPDVVYSANVVTWKSTDAGKTWSAFRGAPGGDDYQRIWIDPQNPRVMLLASDQGAIITVNGGESWSSWYNQPTAQLFHVTADNSWPYRLCGGQQESGSACVASRSDDGVLTFRDWHPAAFEEYGYGAPDPLNPDIVYGGKISRYDRRTGQSRDVSPMPLRGPDYRVVRTQPVVFSPADPHILFFASNTVWKTLDGGAHWQQISPDLTRKTWEMPQNVGTYAKDQKVEQRGVVYALGPSPLDARLLWAGTDDGLLHVTRDGGKTWSNVTPPTLKAWAKVSILDAGHFDKSTAYAAINTLRLDELHPHILKTHDGGKSWTEIGAGLPDGTIVNVVREDPKRRGLLYAGTEQAVFVSFDDGAHWQPLRLNMPATSIRDLIVKDDDLAVATHGRGFWILDDVTPLRQVTDELVASRAALLAPARATRVRFSMYSDTPLQPDEPLGKNPPDGAVLDYYLGADAPVTLEIFDSQGALVRRFSSDDKPEMPHDEGNIPRWWIRSYEPPKATRGLHRFVWDLHYPAPKVEETYFPISAVPHDTAREPRGPWVVPGRYTVKLTAGGESFTKPLEVRLDPRVKVTPAALQQQLAVSKQLVAALAANSDALKRMAPEQKPAQGRRRRRGEPPSLPALNGTLARLLSLVQQTDNAPTPALQQAITRTLRDNDELISKQRAK